MTLDAIQNELNTVKWLSTTNSVATSTRLVVRNAKPWDTCTTARWVKAPVETVRSSAGLLMGLGVLLMGAGVALVGGAL